MQKKRNIKKSRIDIEKARARRKLTAISVLSVVVLAVLALCFLLMAPMFNIKNIVCEGNDKISYDTIVDASQIKTGGNIFLTNLSSPKKNVESLEYVEDCQVSRVFPDTVKFTITERQPAAYFSVGDFLTVTDTNGRVVDTVTNNDDVYQITSSKIKEEIVEPTGSPEPEEDNTKTEDDSIWGYDDDGDQIYKVNGGHYEFDNDGNRYFVDDSPTSSPAAENSEEPTELDSGNNFDELNRTSNGEIIYNAPIIYGVGITKYQVGHRIQSNDEDKLDNVIEAVKSLSKAGLLERTTKIDVNNINDVKFWVEDRLEVWFGTFDNFDYKVKFVTSVIDSNLSKYEESILDFRDSKLYVRSIETGEPKVLEVSPEPNSDEEDSKSSARPKASPIPTDDEDDEGLADDEEQDEENPTSTPKNDNSKNESKHTPTPKTQRN